MSSFVRTVNRGVEKIGLQVGCVSEVSSVVDWMGLQHSSIDEVSEKGE